MARRLKSYVHLRHPDSGERVILAPGDDIPEWAEIADGAFETSYEDMKVGELRDLATERGVEVASDAKKDEIVQALKDAES